jgi:hypothetical protein
MPMILINIAFYNIVYSAKYLHKQCETVNLLNWYIISFFKLHISACVSMHKADELAGKYYVLTLYQYGNLHK